jgi:hypothetical protein
MQYDEIILIKVTRHSRPLARVTFSFFIKGKAFVGSMHRRALSTRTNTRIKRLSNAGVPND